MLQYFRVCMCVFIFLCVCCCILSFWLSGCQQQASKKYIYIKYKIKAANKQHEEKQRNKYKFMY